MKEEVPDDSCSFEDFWKQADEIPEEALLLSAAFRGLPSRDDQLLFLRCSPVKPFASAIDRAIRKCEKAKDDLQLPEPVSLEQPALNMTLSPAEEHTVMVQIELRQRSWGTPSARKVSNQASLLF
jgi:hypothetical protein